MDCQWPITGGVDIRPVGSDGPVTDPRASVLGALSVPALRAPLAADVANPTVGGLATTSHARITRRATGPIPHLRRAAAAGYRTRPPELMSWAMANTVEQVSLYVLANTAPDGAVTAFCGVEGNCLFLIESTGAVRIRGGRRETTTSVEGVTGLRRERFADRAWDPRFAPGALVALVVYDNDQAVMAAVRRGREILRPPRPGPIWLRFFVNDSRPHANAGAFCLSVRRCLAPGSAG